MWWRDGNKENTHQAHIKRHPKSLSSGAGLIGVIWYQVIKGGGYGARNSQSSRMFHCGACFSHRCVVGYRTPLQSSLHNQVSDSPCNRHAYSYKSTLLRVTMLYNLADGPTADGWLTAEHDRPQHSDFGDCKIKQRISQPWWIIPPSYIYYWMDGWKILGVSSAEYLCASFIRVRPRADYASAYCN